MNRRPFLALTLILALLLALAPGALASPDYAYLEVREPWLTVGREARIALVTPGVSGLRVSFELYYTPGRDRGNTMLGVGRQEESPDTAYAFTPGHPGLYKVKALVTLPGQAPLSVESGILYAYDAQDEQRSGTVPERVRAMVNKARAQAGGDDYALALYLHDYLTMNADYDTSLSRTDPDGVLLEGSGVCDSYSLAYQMLLKEAGIPTVYVTGTSKGENHSWNLLQLGGEWTYVDVTWDDPVGGGMEGYQYFGLTSEELRADHDWSQGINLPPQATTRRYNHLDNTGWLPFDSAESLYRELASQLNQKSAQVRLVYRGADAAFDAYNLAYGWLQEHIADYGVASVSISGSERALTLDLTYH